MRAVNEKFADLGNPRRVWAVAAIHGEIDRLVALHDHLATRFATRDRLVYLGNYVGVGGRNNAAVYQELMAFRAALMTKAGVEPHDIVHLRGPTEEAWQRLMRLQFAPVPSQALEKHLAAGVEAYLHLYGFSLTEARSIACAGSVSITHWTNHLRKAQRTHDSHEAFTFSMRRAATTVPVSCGGQRLLFVPAGFDAARSLEDQGDNFWYGPALFRSSGSTFTRVVRGFDPADNGVNTEGSAMTLDDGCGRGGALLCGCFTEDGKLLEVVAIGGKGAVESLPFTNPRCETTPDPRAFSRRHEIQREARYVGGRSAFF